MTVIDAHQHVWNLDRAPYDWLGPDAGVINRTIEFDELEPHLVRHGITGTVLVQSADDDADTAYMLEVAAERPEVVAVVGYVPMHDPDGAARRLETLDPLVVGIRNLIHDRPDPDWLLQPAFEQTLRMLERRGLAYDVVGVLPRHLEHVPVLAARHPDLTFVIDHLNKPPVGLADREPWWSLIADAAAHPNVVAKASGLYAAEGNPADWTPDAVRPFFDRAVEVFGIDRLMYGGDWPVAMLAGDYDGVWNGMQQVVAGLSEPERQRFFAGTAVERYGVDADRLAAAETAAASRPH